MLVCFPSLFFFFFLSLFLSFCLGGGRGDLLMWMDSYCWLLYWWSVSCAGWREGGEELGDRVCVLAGRNRGSGNRIESSHGGK